MNNYLSGLLLLLSLAAPQVMSAASYPATIRNEKDGSVLVRVPAGAFTMGVGEADGSDSWERPEYPAHEVTLAEYYIGKFDVTNAQFRRFVGATGYHSPGDWRRAAARWGEQAPVIEVSWNDAQAYCRWAGLRLPTEAEWEKAARGPDRREYPWGDKNPDMLCRNSIPPSRDQGPAAVGSYPAAASPFGCLDMAGNVWQWTASWYQAYPPAEVSSPFDHAQSKPSSTFGQTYRVVRGGSWVDTDRIDFVTWRREYYHPGYFDTAVGFRVVLSKPVSP